MASRDINPRAKPQVAPLLSDCPLITKLPPTLPRIGDRLPLRRWPLFWLILAASAHCEIGFFLQRQTRLPAALWAARCCPLSVGMRPRLECARAVRPAAVRSLVTHCRRIFAISPSSSIYLPRAPFSCLFLPGVFDGSPPGSALWSGCHNISAAITSWQSSDIHSCYTSPCNRARAPVR